MSLKAVYATGADIPIRIPFEREGFTSFAMGFLIGRRPLQRGNHV